MVPARLLRLSRFDSEHAPEDSSMHELSIAVSLIDLATEAVEDAGLTGPVQVVRLRIGALSGVVVEALEFAWDTAAERTICEGSQLEIERIPARIHCEFCNDETVLDDPPVFVCGHCGKAADDVLAGKELDLMALELEERVSE